MVALWKDRKISSHEPGTISCMCTRFLRNDGTIASTITRPSRYFHDLAQGGQELPCEYMFTGPDDVAMTAHELSRDDNDGIVNEL